jgi:CBS domain-containing protein
MTVARILTNKGRNVVTVRPERTLLEISAELMRHGIGAVVVVDDTDSIVGLVSERDIVAAIVSCGPNALSDSVVRHMTSNPRVASEDDTIVYVMEKMTLERRRHLPIVHNGHLTGLVSIGDVVKYRIEAIENESKGLRDYIASE